MSKNLLLDDEDEVDPFTKGWYQGSHDKPCDCPYDFGTKDYEEFMNGYKEGCRDY